MKKLFVLILSVCMVGCFSTPEVTGVTEEGITKEEALKECTGHCESHDGLRGVDYDYDGSGGEWCKCENGIYFTTKWGQPDWTTQQCETKCKNDGGVEEGRIDFYICYCNDGAKKYCR